MGLLSWLFRGDDKEELVKVGAGARQMQSASMGTSGMQQRDGMQHSGHASGMTMTKDPVCGMDVNPETAAATSVYDGTTYYFCASRCKQAFDENPTMYLSGPMKGGTHGGNHQGGCCC